MRKIIFIFIGIFFGIVLYKSEAASWFRIYEMFQFDAFHMYGLIGSALAVGMVIMQFIKRKQIKDACGNRIVIHEKDKSLARYLIGGVLFGLGWALVGVCPGPMFVLIGAGYLPILIVLLGALIGTWIYGLLRSKLPH